MLSVADSPNEGALEGAGALNERYVQFMEARLDSQGQAQMLFQGDASPAGMQSFNQAIVQPDGITFHQPAGMDGSALTGLDSAMPQPIGDAISSIVQSMINMPGGAGLLVSFFQFLGNLFGAIAQGIGMTAADLARSYAAAAQSAMDMAKMMKS